MAVGCWVTFCMAPWLSKLVEVLIVDVVVVVKAVEDQLFWGHVGVRTQLGSGDDRTRTKDTDNIDRKNDRQKSWKALPQHLVSEKKIIFFDAEVENALILSLLFRIEFESIYFRYLRNT